MSAKHIGDNAKVLGICAKWQGDIANSKSMTEKHIGNSAKFKGGSAKL